MTYLSGWADAERAANPNAFDAEMERVAFRHVMRTIKFATVETTEDVRAAAERLEEILR